MSLNVISQNEQKISIKLKGIPLQYANALRRICLNGVPIYAIDTVDVLANSSYSDYEQLRIRLPREQNKRPSAEALWAHLEEHDLLTFR